MLTDGKYQHVNDADPVRGGRVSPRDAKRLALLYGISGLVMVLIEAIAFAYRHRIGGMVWMGPVWLILCLVMWFRYHRAVRSRH